MKSKKNGHRVKSSWKSSYPKATRLLQILCVVLSFLWARSMIAALHSAEKSAELPTSGYSSPSSDGEGIRKVTPMTSSSSSSSASEGLCRHLSGGDPFGVAVVMDTLKGDELLSIGGTGHWFHLVERILPYIIPAAKKVWKAGAKRRAQMNLMASGDKQRNATPSRLYIVFREDVGVSGLDAFSRFLLSSVFSGGYYDEVIIGYADEVGNGIMENSNSGEGAIKNFHKHATMFYPNADAQGETYTEVVYERGSRNFRDVPGEKWDTVRKGDHETVRDIPILCVNALMQVSWDNSPPKRYFLLGNDSDAYSLLHASIENTCKLEPLPGVNTIRTAARYLGVSQSTLMQNQRVDEDDLLHSAAYGGVAPADEIAAEKIRQKSLPRDDFSRLPVSLSPSKEGHGETISEYTLPQEGRVAGPARDDPRDEVFTRKVAKLAAALADRGAVGELVKSYNFNVDKEVLKRRYADANTVLKMHDVLVANHARDGGLTPAPVSMGVPLRVLVYDRDQSRRIQNVQEAVDTLRTQLQLTDRERHLHFPVTYHSRERKPGKGPALGVGSLREVGGNVGAREGTGVGGKLRRKSGGYMQDHSGLRDYDHGHEKVAWTVELMTHNEHHTHNPHAGHLHDPATGTDTAVHSSAARSGQTTTEHLPSCQVARALREATVLVTPHGFQSILTLLQPPKSLLVEVFPYGYNKPEIFGLVQAGMRVHRYGKHRSYLHGESPPTRFLPRLMHSLRILDDPFINGVALHTGMSEKETREALEAQLWHIPDGRRGNGTQTTTAVTEAMQRLRRAEESSSRSEPSHTPDRWHLFSHATCTANIVCRHVAKSQDVLLTQPFLRRVTEYAKAHYVSNHDKDEYLPG